MNNCNILITALLLTIAGIVVSSCDRSKIEQELKQLNGTEIIIPHDSLLAFNYKDKVQLDSSEYKYVIYYDSTVCSTCTLKNMYYWEVLRDSVSSLGANVYFVFIFAPRKEERGKFLSDLKNTREEFIAFVDTSGCFIKRNCQIPQNVNAHAFLLDSENKVIMVGNAQNNPAIETLFWKIIHRTNEK